MLSSDELPQDEFYVVDWAPAIQAVADRIQAVSGPPQTVFPVSLETYNRVKALTEPSTDWASLLEPARAADMDYIRESWIRAYRVSPWAGCIPNNLVSSVYTQAIDDLIQRGARLLTIRNPANPQQLLGFCCYEITPRREAVVHFAFVKPTFRRLGACNAMLAYVLAAVPERRFFITFRTAASKYFKNCTFRPEIARRKDAGTPVA